MNNDYKITIIGGGAVGLTYAYLLAGHAQVTVKTRRQEQADLINAEGISILLDGKTEVITNIPATADMAGLAESDAVIVTVKSYDTEEVAKELNKVLRPSTIVLTIQNGIQALAVLKATIDSPERVFAGVTYIGASRTDDRSVKNGTNRRTVIDSKAASLVSVFEKTRFGVEAVPNIMQAVWDKMVLNTGQNALSAITDLHLGEMLECSHCLDIARHLLDELQSVARAEGIVFDYTPMDKLRDNWTDTTFYPSMWQDIHKKRRTEIDAINGAIGQLGKKHGIPTPCNDMLTSLIKIAESKT